MPYLARRFCPLLLLLLLWLAGCGGQDPASPAVERTRATATPLQKAASAEASAQETSSAEEIANGGAPLVTSVTPGPDPTGPTRSTDTPTAAATARATETATPTETPAPTNTPQASPTGPPPATSTPTPTVTPSPTPLPPTIESRGALMLLVPGDFFAMGVTPDVLADECSLFGRTCEEALLAPAGPQHPAYVDSFYMDAFEVANAAFVTFLNDSGEPQAACQNVPCLDPESSRIRQADGRYEVEPGFHRHPVTGVTWYGAALFCTWRGARLPTEAEWEMAASWESATSNKTLYPWGNDFEGNAANTCDVNCTQAQSIGIFDDGYAETAPVGNYPRGRSPAGAHDMAGNVWEWVSDWFGRDYYARAPQENPQGPSSGTGRVLRGGSWFDTGNFTATVFRSGLPPDQSNNAIGFRCAVEAGPRSSE